MDPINMSDTFLRCVLDATCRTEFVSSIAATTVVFVVAVWLNRRLSRTKLVALLAVALAACADSDVHEDPEAALPDDPFIVAERARERLEELRPELASLAAIVKRDRGAVDAYQGGVDALGNQIFVVDTTRIRAAMCENTTEWAGEQVDEMLSWVIALGNFTMSMDRFKLRFARADSAIVATMDCWHALWADEEFDAHRRLWRAQMDSVEAAAQRRAEANMRRSRCRIRVRNELVYTPNTGVRSFALREPRTEQDDKRPPYLLNVEPDSPALSKWIVTTTPHTPRWLDLDRLKRAIDGHYESTARRATANDYRNQKAERTC